MNRYFTKEHIQMANKHKQSCWTSSGTGEIQTKSLMIYYQISTTIAEKGLSIGRADEDIKVMEMQNSIVSLENSLAVLSS